MKPRKGSPKRQEILDEFDKECQDKTRQAMSDSYDEIRGLRTDLEKSELKIIPAQMAGNNVFQIWKGWWRAYGANAIWLARL